MGKGLFITEEILKTEGLNFIEKGILSIYKSYTKHGQAKCCKMRNEQIADELGISKSTVKRTKTKLKELGYIRTDGGIKVWYVGVKIKLNHQSSICTPKRGSN